MAESGSSTTPDFPALLRIVASGRPLRRHEARIAFEILMDGAATPVQIAGFLAGLAARGEHVDELIAGAQVMRERATRVEAPEGCIDTCGTGGDGKGTLNISTAAALVLAGAGVPVAKHGNRAASSRSGSSQVLEELGVRLDVPPELVSRAIREAGIGFLMAPRHHRAMVHVAPVRKELGVRTIFNLLGPLANPAGAKDQLLGVYDAKWLLPLAEVLRQLGSGRVWIVHGADGLDELSISGETHVAALDSGAIETFTVSPEDADLPIHPLEAIKGGDPATNAAALKDLLDGAKGAYRDIVVLNAAAGLMVAKRVDTLAEGARKAEEALDTGAARAALEKLIAVTHSEPDQPVTGAPARKPSSSDDQGSEGIVR